jgi:4'-phosphopantetheinyl transferase
MELFRPIAMRTERATTSSLIEPPHPGEVHLWKFSLNLASGDVHDLWRSLRSDEIERANGYVFDRDRSKFVAARGKLRAILARYLCRAPAQIAFRYGPNGKPYLAELGSHLNLQFNLAHSRDLALCAVVLDREVGVDVEWMRQEVDILGIARSAFSPSERDRLVALPAHRRLDAFYACWTRKEAYIKARGEGLAYPLDAFDVSMEPGLAETLLRSDEGWYEQTRWTLCPVRIASGYAAALAVERPLHRLTTMV